MKDRPILFSAPMIRALLAGTKTQTRRTLKHPTANRNIPGQHAPIEPYRTPKGDWNFVLAATGHGLGDPFACPYGKPGDRLWVREAFAHIFRDNSVPGERRADDVAYKADGFTVMHEVYGTWKPGIHMPRWASRITLEVTAVRVERLQDISEADATSEGVDEWARGACGDPDALDATGKFELLWCSIKGRQSWDANPWCWAITFKRVPQ